MKKLKQVSLYVFKISHGKLRIFFSFLLVFLFCAGKGMTSFPWNPILQAGSDFKQEVDNPEPSLTLEECLEIALAYNPLILSTDEQFKAARARINIARAIPGPEILLDYPLQPKFLSPARSEEKFFWIFQIIEFPGRRYLRGRVASLEAIELFQDYESLKLDIAFQVKEAFFGLLLAEEKLKYALENLQLSRQFVEMTEVKYSAGEISRAEVLRSQVEMVRAESMVKRYEKEREIMAARLNTLLGRDKNQKLKIKGELKRSFVDLSLDQAREIALSLRPEIRKIKYSLDKLNLKKKQALLNYFPDLNLGFARHQIGREKYWDFSLGFSVPLFFWQIRRGELAETEASLRAAEKELVYWKNMVCLEIDEAYQQVMCSQEQIKLLTEKILPQAEEVYELFLFSYKEGQIGGLDLIEARRTLIESKTVYAEQLYQHAVSLAALTRAMGKLN